MICSPCGALLLVAALLLRDALAGLLVVVRRFALLLVRRVAHLMGNYANIQIQKFTNTQIHKYTNIQIHKYTNTQIQRHIPFCSHSAMSVRALTHSSSFLEYQKKQVWVVTTIIKLIWEVQKSSFSPKEIVCVVAHRVFLLVI